MSVTSVRFFSTRPPADWITYYLSPLTHPIHSFYQSHHRSIKIVGAGMGVYALGILTGIVIGIWKRTLIDHYVAPSIIPLWRWLVIGINIAKPLCITAAKIYLLLTALSCIYGIGFVIKHRHKL